jgi:hypothetical protein
MRGRASGEEAPTSSAQSPRLSNVRMTMLDPAVSSTRVVIPAADWSRSSALSHAT